MAASPVLVDSSWYIAVGRKGGDPLGLLGSVAEARDVATCGIVRCEVARGLRSPKALRVFQAAWDVMMCVPTDNKLWQDVESTVWQIDRTLGGALPLADIIIACCARRIGAVVLTFDRHFQRIPGIVAVDRIV
jgi:predicted nucleic acid-binding protein